MRLLVAQHQLTQTRKVQRPRHARMRLREHGQVRALELRAEVAHRLVRPALLEHGALVEEVRGLEVGDGRGRVHEAPPVELQLALEAAEQHEAVLALVGGVLAERGLLRVLDGPAVARVEGGGQTNLKESCLLTDASATLGSLGNTITHWKSTRLLSTWCSARFVLARCCVLSALGRNVVTLYSTTSSSVLKSEDR